MVGLAAPAILAFVLSLALGGSTTDLSQLRIRWWPLALLALAIQIPLYSAPIGHWVPVGVVGPLATIATTALVLVLLVRNASGKTRIACLVAAAGVALNLTAIALNGGYMPRADELAPRPLSRDTSATSVSNTAPATSETRLAWLGDTIAQPAWLPLANLVSPGDVLLAFGAAGWVLAATRRVAGEP
jgi:Family of unknown function (DUF5317)